ncbi:hypothetical protein I5677_05445 [Mobilitalea sibirica]|uniref:AP2/ERF domain-containing protein n=1 Tax=Mobilitalea sibirica TaxID=1462919 RepID=A0A8J7H8L0_9FIRM|nr:hypothetical protein [Mobilitalea sibirica]MBH1940340.1 hypothetical protein [Mobilitalea sibirica]
MLPGVYLARKKSGEIYYRASITYKGKHISLGSYPKEEDANKAYDLAGDILLESSPYRIDNYPSDCIIEFHKWVVLINFRDNHIYFKNPIYIKKRFFLYYIDINTPLKFDVDDLFYYAHHKILKRGGHLFVSDYGMQVNILARYGIKNYAVPGRDYLFINGDDTDYRYGNIEIINRYHGVTKTFHKGLPVYTAKIHINGDFLIGRYSTDNEAAIAYNKAALILNEKGLNKNFPQNYIEGMDEITYASTYQKLRISKKLLSYADTLDQKNYINRN